jgi:RNA polymerase sigma-70 factor (ECF subfamily)
MGLTTRSELIRKVKRYLAKAGADRPGRGSPEYAIVEEFVALYQPILVRFCKRPLRIRDQDSIDEIVQNVWQSVFKQLPKFDYDRNRGGFRRWLYVILKRRALDYGKRQRRERKLGGQPHSSALLENTADPNTEDPSRRLEQAFRLEVLRAAFRMFRLEAPEREFYAYKRCDVEGAKAVDVARELSVSAENVRNALGRARRRFRRILSELIGDDFES